GPGTSWRSKPPTAGWPPSSGGGRRLSRPRSAWPAPPPAPWSAGCHGRSREGRRRGRRHRPRPAQGPSGAAPRARKARRPGPIRAPWRSPGRRHQTRQATRRRKVGIACTFDLPRGAPPQTSLDNLRGGARKVVCETKNQGGAPRKTACVLGPKFEDSELREPHDAFRDARPEVTVVVLDARSWRSGGTGNYSATFKQ